MLALVYACAAIHARAALLCLLVTWIIVSRHYGVLLSTIVARK